MVPEWIQERNAAMVRDQRTAFLIEKQIALVSALKAYAEAYDGAGNDNDRVREQSGHIVRGTIRNSVHLRDVMDFVTPHRHADNSAGRKSCSCGSAWADEPGHDDES